MANFLPDWINAAAERGAPEHTPGPQDAQALRMLDNGHLINPYGDTYEAGSVAASNEDEPWPLPSATAPTAIAEADEPGHAELELHLQSIRHAAQHAAEQLGPLVKSPPPPPPPERPPPVPADVSGVPPAPSGVPPAGREPPPQPPAEPRADVAAEHVLLSRHDLPELRRRKQPGARNLHDEARSWTNSFAQRALEPVGVQADLTQLWKNWKEYIANHKKAEEIVGSGVVAFTAEFIDGTKDPNRGGIPRLDLVIRHVDGGYVRLHPGSMPKNDAVPRFFPGSAPEHASRFVPSNAPEHAAFEWRMPGADGVFSIARAILVPQVDRLGKEEVWQTVQTLASQGFIPNERDPGSWLDITDGTRLRWWLWICNLGSLTRSVIGTGVCSAHIAMNMEHEAVFKFVRPDESECILRLCCTNEEQGRKLRTYM